MRIKPTGETPAAPTATGVDETSAAAAPAAAAPIAHVDGPAAPSAAGAATGAAPVGGVAAVPPALVAEIAAQLRAGALSPGQAVDRLIDEIVERGAGRALPDRRRLADDLRAFLRRQAELDPHLAARVRRFGAR